MRQSQAGNAFFCLVKVFKLLLILSRTDSKLWGVFRGGKVEEERA